MYFCFSGIVFGFSKLLLGILGFALGYENRLIIFSFATMTSIIYNPLSLLLIIKKKKLVTQVHLAAQPSIGLNFHPENEQSNESQNMTFMEFIDKCERKRMKDIAKKSHASRDTRLILDIQTLDNVDNRK